MENLTPFCGSSPKNVDMSSTPGHRKASAGQGVEQPTELLMCNSKGEAITRSDEVARQDAK